MEGESENTSFERSRTESGISPETEFIFLSNPSSLPTSPSRRFPEDEQETEITAGNVPRRSLFLSSPIKSGLTTSREPEMESTETPEQVYDIVEIVGDDTRGKSQEKSQSDVANQDSSQINSLKHDLDLARQQIAILQRQHQEETGKTTLIAERNLLAKTLKDLVKEMEGLYDALQLMIQLGTGSEIWQKQRKLFREMTNGMETLMDTCQNLADLHEESLKKLGELNSEAILVPQLKSTISSLKLELESLGHQSQQFNRRYQVTLDDLEKQTLKFQQLALEHDGLRGDLMEKDRELSQVVWELNRSRQREQEYVEQLSQLQKELYNVRREGEAREDRLKRFMSFFGTGEGGVGMGGIESGGIGGMESGRVEGEDAREDRGREGLQQVIPVQQVSRPPAEAIY